MIVCFRFRQTKSPIVLLVALCAALCLITMVVFTRNLGVPSYYMLKQVARGNAEKFAPNRGLALEGLVAVNPVNRGCSCSISSVSEVNVFNDGLTTKI